jgi:DNA modification methylase
MNRKESLLPIELIKPNPHNARTHSKKQIAQIAASIEANGYGASVLVDENYNLIAGHGRLFGMKHLGRTEIPATILEGLKPFQKRALALADNRIALDAGWDTEILAIELSEIEPLLQSEGLDITVTGFSHAEVDELHVNFDGPPPDPADKVRSSWISNDPVSKPGYLWQLGSSRLLCGDALSEADHHHLLGGEQAAMACHDVPYNVRIADVVGRGRTSHAEFAMASGEMSRSEYMSFLSLALTNTRRFSKDGAVAFIFTDWRHVDQLIGVGRDILGELINLICWVKSNPGMGSFYRSEHELITVFRVGQKAPLNNIELGRHGRSRSNVWRYPGANQSGAGRQLLKHHPTPKPIALIADAIKDCTRRGDIVLDCFVGSGATIMAAEKVGRRAFAMEIAPKFVDLSVRRWQDHTGKDAVHTESGRTFDQCAEQARAAEIRNEASSAHVGGSHEQPV